jgi:hypothetical protein
MHKKANFGSCIDEVTIGERTIVSIGVIFLLFGRFSWDTSMLRAKFERKGFQAGRWAELFHEL